MFLMENYKSQRLTSYKDNYKIVSSTVDDDGIAGNYLDQQTINDPRRP